jgi:hypothetical protein
MELYLVIRNQLKENKDAQKCVQQLRTLQPENHTERALEWEMLACCALQLEPHVVTGSDKTPLNSSNIAEKEVELQYTLSEAYLKQLVELLEDRQNLSIVSILKQLPSLFDEGNGKEEKIQEEKQDEKYVVQKKTDKHPLWSATYQKYVTLLQSYPLPQWFSQVKKLLFLNLAKRTDRCEFMEQQFQKLGLAEKQWKRIEAVEDSVYGAAGATKTHCLALDWCVADMKNSQPQGCYYLILEDDFEFISDVQLVHTTLDSALNGKLHPNFQPMMLNLGMNIQKSHENKTIGSFVRIRTINAYGSLS